VITSHHPIVILLADDDADDRQLTREALAENRLLNDVHEVPDGEALMDYLFHRGEYAELRTSPKPGLILLDLSMPKKDGREALAEIKADPQLRQIPVIVMTTSSAEEDVCRSYDLGASSYVTKPVSFTRLVEVMRGIEHYWFEIVKLPS
jgi:CheY-like chemotaxis protein